MRNMKIMQKLGNKFWLQIVGVVVVLTATVVAIVFWPANDLRKANTEIGEQKIKVEKIQAHQDKNGGLAVQTTHSAKRKSSKRVSSSNLLEDDAKMAKLMEIVAARKAATGDKSDVQTTSQE